MNTTISIQLSDEIMNYIRSITQDPESYIQNLISRKLKKELARSDLEWIRTHRLQSQYGTVEQQIREFRDGRY